MIPGLALLLFGLFLLLSQLNLIPGETFLIFLGIVFIGVYYITGKVGFLIPGCILLGFGIGVTVLELRILEMPDYMLVFGGLAVGFYLISILGFKKTGTWPLIPGTVILLLAFFIYGMETGFVQNSMKAYLELALPVILIGFGTLVLIRSFVRPKK